MGYDYPKSKIFFKIRTWSLNHLDLCIFLFSLLVGCLSAYYFYQKGLIIAYIDASSHLNIARRVVDSLTPGLAQFGGSWPPFLHLSMLPFIWNDFLWYTGLAGTIPSVFYFAITTTFLFKLTSEYWGDRKVGLLAVFVFVTCPSVLYFATVPMFEMTFLMTVMLSTYWFYKYLETSNLIHLLCSTISIMLSCLTWYPGWVLPFFFLFVLLLKLILENDGWLTLTEIGIRKFLSERWQKIEGYGLVYAMPAFSGIIAWFMWSWIIFGTPWDFLVNEWSFRAGSIKAETVRTSYDLLGSVINFTYAAIHMIGLSLITFSLVGCLFFYFTKKDVRSFSLFGMIAPVTFFISTLFINGSDLIMIPETGGWFNERYAITCMLFVAFFSASLIALAKKKSEVVSTILLILLSLIVLSNTAQSFIKNDSNILKNSDFLTYLENNKIGGTCSLLTSAKSKKRECVAIELGKTFSQMYDGGNILMVTGAHGSATMSIIRESKIQMKEIINEGNYRIFQNTLEKPWKDARWIIMHKTTDPRSHPDYITLRWGNSKLIHKVYSIVYEDNMIGILKLNRTALSHLPMYQKHGYFEIEDLDYSGDKLQFTFSNFEDLQPSINILVTCRDTPSRISFHLYNVTKNANQTVTLPIVSKCKNLNLTVKGNWYEYHQIVKHNEVIP